MFRYAVVVALVAGPAFAGKALAQGISDVCQTYAKFALETLKGESSISIGRFKTAERFGLATGRGVEMELRKAFENEKEGIVVAKAKYEVRGEADYVTAEDKIRYLVLQFRVFDTATDKELPEVAHRYAFTDIEDIARLFGATVRLPAGKTIPERSELMGKALDAPGGAVIRSVSVAPSQDSPYRLSVIKTTNGARDHTAIKLIDGRPVTKLRKTDSFELEIDNHSQTDIGAQLFLDGIDSYSFAQKGANGRPFATAYRMPANSSWRLMGWHFTQFNWEEFRFDKPRTVALPPAQDTKWSSATIVISTIRPDPKAPGRFITEDPLDFLTLWIDSNGEPDLPVIDSSSGFWKRATDNAHYFTIGAVVVVAACCGLLIRHSRRLRSTLN